MHWVFLFIYGFCSPCACTLVKAWATRACCMQSHVPSPRWGGKGMCRYCWGARALGFLLLWKEGCFPACLVVKRQPESWEQLDLAGRDPVLGQRSRWAAAEIERRFLWANELTFQSFFQGSSSCQPKWKRGFPPDLACILLFWTYTMLRFVSKYTIWRGYITAFVLPIQNLPLLLDTLFYRNSALV